jgi:hypothetical protein
LLEGDASCESIKMIKLLQDQVMSKAEEVYLMNHVKLYQQKQSFGDDEQLKTFLRLHQRFSNRSAKNENLKTFSKFLNFKKFPNLLEILVQIVNSREIIGTSCENLEIFEDSIQFLLSLGSKSDDS